MYFGAYFGGGSGSSSPSYPVLANATTVEAIRDRIYDVIEGLTPRVNSRDRFRRYRNEGGADFIAWADANPAGALRRFQVRQSGDDPPESSNTDYERRRCRFLVIIAYPQTARTGPQQAMDRDDARDADFFQINAEIGWNGRVNFSDPYPDASTIGAAKGADTGQACDFLTIECEFYYQCNVQ